MNSVTFDTGQERAAHRHFAVSAYNAVWKLLDKKDRTPAEDQQMLAAAFASRYHWSFIGDDRNFAIGDWQIAHVASYCGLPKTAHKYASSALAIVEKNGWRDWILASVYEGMARASAVGGNDVERGKWLEKAKRECALIAEEDERAIIEQQITTVPECVRA